MSAAPDIKWDQQDYTTSYAIAKDYLKSQVAYIFENTKYKPDSWNIATWCFRVSRSSIEKFGTLEDKLRLGVANNMNKKRRSLERENDNGEITKRRRRIKNKSKPRQQFRTRDQTVLDHYHNDLLQEGIVVPPRQDAPPSEETNANYIQFLRRKQKIKKMLA